VGARVAALAEHRRGDQAYGSWCAALRAAGLPARIPAKDLPRRERVAEAKRLANLGFPIHQIADVLQVSPATVRAYRLSEPCPNCGDPITTACLRAVTEHGPGVDV
jgi:hypothetical protein